MPALIESRELQMEVKKLPVLSTGSLCSDSEWRKAYVVLCFLANGYVWALSPPVDTLPPALSVPLLEVAGRLELPPVATYAGLVLWNYTNTDLNDFRPESLQVRYTFTGTSDEAWFYLISVAVEAEGRHIVPRVLSTIDSLKAKDFLKAGDALAEIGEWKGYRGGSNGQSALFHFLDIVLGVQHEPFRSDTSIAPGVDASDGFFREMVEYMPKHHRELLNSFATRENLRDLIMSTVGKPHYARLWQAYAATTERLAELRNSHLRIVARYIIVPSRADRNADTSREGLIGTGSTALIPFLRQSRNETFRAVEFDVV
ncbi:indoleamine -dioxygenase protein [Colletotrichum camelliae]|nr:indoleamine -dioxygenase protein [Colletotrichum camelliae]